MRVQGWVSKGLSCGAFYEFPASGWLCIPESRFGGNGFTLKIRAMNEKASAEDANRRFSELLRTVKNGRSVVVTSHGKPVARISPMVEDNLVAEGARSVLFARLSRERAVNAGRWTREELYDDVR